MVLYFFLVFPPFFFCFLNLCPSSSSSPTAATLPSFMRHKSESAFCQCEEQDREEEEESNACRAAPWEGDSGSSSEDAENKKWGKNMQTSLGKTCARIFPAAFRAFYFTYFFSLHFPAGKWKATAKNKRKKLAIIRFGEFSFIF